MPTPQTLGGTRQGIAPANARLPTNIAGQNVAAGGSAHPLSGVPQIAAGSSFGLSGWSKITGDLARTSFAAIEQQQLQEQKRKAELAAARAAKLAAAAAEAAVAKEAELRAQALAQSQAAAEQERAKVTATEQAVLEESKRLAKAGDDYTQTLSLLEAEQQAGGTLAEDFNSSSAEQLGLSYKSTLEDSDETSRSASSLTHTAGPNALDPSNPFDLTPFTASILDRRRAVGNDDDRYGSSSITSGGSSYLDVISGYTTKFLSAAMQMLPRPRSTTLSDRWGYVDPSSTLWDDVRPLALPFVMLVIHAVVIFLVLRVVLFYYSDQSISSSIIGSTQAIRNGLNAQINATTRDLVNELRRSATIPNALRSSRRLNMMRFASTAETCPYPLVRLLYACAGHSAIIVTALLIFLYDIRSRPRAFQTASLFKRINRRWLYTFILLVPVAHILLAIWMESWLGGLGLGYHDGMLQCYLTAPVTFTTARSLGVFEAIVPAAILAWCFIKLDRDGTLQDSDPDPGEIDWEAYDQFDDLETCYSPHGTRRRRGRRRSLPADEAAALLGSRNIYDKLLPPRQSVPPLGSSGSTHVDASAVPGQMQDGLGTNASSTSAATSASLPSSLVTPTLTVTSSGETSGSQPQQSQQQTSSVALAAPRPRVATQISSSPPLSRAGTPSVTMPPSRTSSSSPDGSNTSR